MSWETVDAFPDEQRDDGGSGPFRAGSVPIVARRSKPDPLERLRLWWLSTPEHPSERAAHELVLTPEHLYVRFADDQVRRIPRSALRGRRVDRGRVIYGVVEGEDFALLPRSNCSILAALDTEVVRHLESPLVYSTEGIPMPNRRRVRGLILLLAGIWIAVGTFYYPVAAIPIASVALIALATVYVGIVKRRVTVDRVGIHIQSGPWGLLHQSFVPEQFESVRFRFSGGRDEPTLRVELVLKEPPRWGSREVLAREIDIKHTSRAFASTQGRRIAEAVSARLGVPMEE